MTYTVLNLGDAGIGGMMRMSDEVPAAVPAFWMTYFEVADCDASAAKAQELGGTVIVPPADIPGVGRFAIVRDAAGATFGIIATVRDQPS